MDIENNLSECLARLVDIGLTQNQIGEEIGCSQPTVSDLLRGKIGKKRPSNKIVEGVKALVVKHKISLPCSPKQAAPISQQKREPDPGTRTTSPSVEVEK